MPRVPNYPCLRVRKWHKYQKSLTYRYIRVESNARQNPKVASLSMADFGLLVSIWITTGALDEWLPQDPAELALSLNVARTKHFSRSLERLIERGFLAPISPSERTERERGTSGAAPQDCSRGLSTPSPKGQNRPEQKGESEFPLDELRSQLRRVK